MISIDGLHFKYNNEQALFEDFNLEIQHGQLFGLLGPNGAGKSTLIALICGLYSPSAGTIHIDNLDLAKQRKKILQSIAVVPQDYAFYPKLTAIENLSFFAHLYPGLKQPKAGIEQVVEMTGLAGFAHRQAGTYSGGMKRRLNLAIGLLNRPQLLILDEPTVGIDPQSRHFILESIREINEMGTTVLYTSHYMEEVEKLCDHVAVIDHGRILVSGELNELLNRGAQFRARLAKSVILHDEKLIAISKDHQLHIEGGYLTGDAKDVEQSAVILNELLSAGIKVEELYCGKQSLESLFFELTHTELREH
jgi:ABC-2 type transport system ATP-binding protein